MQSDAFQNWVAGALSEALTGSVSAAGITRQIKPILLSVPRAIEAGSLKGPAIDQFESTVESIRRLLHIS